ncbi:MAG: DNA replication/repair protein RecF [Proteobacteria bacterium]|nr:MAG: DNA replication/repair protein RecF [Pseudomonadota bacterium]
MGRSCVASCQGGCAARSATVLSGFHQVLTTLEIENFRCIEAARLELDLQGTGILGANASGKTSLLEAIYFLGLGRSFRTTVREKLVREGAEYFRVVGRIRTQRGDVTAGIEYRDGTTRARLAGQDVAGMSEVAEALPIQIIDPGVHRLVEEGSARRRRLLDWGVFHVEHDFLGVWRRYQRGLKQRNAALRAGAEARLVGVWEQELVDCAGRLDEARRRYVERLRPYFEEVTRALLGAPANLGYQRGWAGDESLAEALERVRARDDKLRTTTVGPHRADLTFRLGSSLARDRVSRGQQKMLAAALILAQIQVRATLPGEPTCLLLDDPAAELDGENLGKLLGVIRQTPAQLVVTSVSEAGLRGIPIGRVFHVEQGRFRAVE